MSRLSAQDIVNMMRDYDNPDLPIAQIAKRFNVSRQTVLNIRKNLGLPPRQPKTSREAFEEAGKQLARHAKTREHVRSTGVPPKKRSSRAKKRGKEN